MKILFAAPENAWGGILEMLRTELPDHQFEATGGFHIASLADTDVLIPTMCPVTGYFRFFMPDETAPRFRLTIPPRLRFPR